jgi:ribokinase
MRRMLVDERTGRKIQAVRTNLNVLVVGEVAVDVLVACGEPPVVWGQAETLVDDARVALGSSGAICAAALARLGLPVGFAGIAGDDSLGEFFIGELRRLGVDVGAVRRAPGRATGITVALHREHDRGMLTFPGTMDALSDHDVDDQWLVRGAHLHVSSPFLQRGLWPGLGSLLRRARARALTISLDPGFDPCGRWTEPVQEVLGLVDWLLPNETEALGLASARAGVVIRDREQALEILSAAGCAVVIKRGGAGALLRSARRSLRLDTEPLVPLDTTGAGDNFDAGFIAALLNGADPAVALAWGVACGRHAVSGRGGTGAMSDAARLAETLGELPVVRDDLAISDRVRARDAILDPGGAA